MKRELNEEVRYNSCFCFPGIGESYVGIINKLSEKPKKMLIELAIRAKNVYNIDVVEYLEDKHTNKSYDLLTIWASNYICDYVAYQLLIDNGIVPKYMMGYSMGMVTSLACSGAITFEEGIRISQENIKYHKVHKEEEMAAVIGLSSEDLERIIKDNGYENSVYIGCENNEYCYVISGIKEHINELLPVIKENGAIKIKLLDTSFAFHSRYMLENIEEFKDFINKLTVKQAKVPILYANTQTYISNSQEIKEAIISNVYSKVRWQKSIELMAENCECFVEIGFSKSLKKITKIICPNKKFFDLYTLSCDS